MQAKRAGSEGFEPPEAFTSTVFKTVAIGRSANSCLNFEGSVSHIRQVILTHVYRHIARAGPSADFYPVSACPLTLRRDRSQPSLRCRPHNLLVDRGVKLAAVE